MEPIAITERMRSAISYAQLTERPPQSRYFFGSPCRFIRTLDMAVHVVLPELIANKLPGLASYLRSTSPRWGRAWRSW